jgi:hypothetical protein
MHTDDTLPVVHLRAICDMMCHKLSVMLLNEAKDILALEPDHGSRFLCPLAGTLPPDARQPLLIRQLIDKRQAAPEKALNLLCIHQRVNVVLFGHVQENLSVREGGIPVSLNKKAVNTAVNTPTVDKQTLMALCPKPRVNTFTRGMVGLGYSPPL